MALSQRAEELSKPKPGHRFFEVLDNLWDRHNNPKGYVNLGIAENSLMHKPMVAKINESLRISEQNLTYGDDQAQLRKTLATSLNKHLRPFTPIQSVHLSAVNGCTTALQNLSWALAGPGDTILIGRPFYGWIPMDICRRTGVELVAIDSEDCDPMGVQVLPRFEEEIRRIKIAGQRVAGIVLLHAHNPLGRYYAKTVLQSYMKLCQKYDLHLISNEIYALSTWENRVDNCRVAKFQSILSIDPQGLMDPDRLHVLWGMSKDFGANGLRLGVTITQHNEALRTALKSVFEFSWTSSLADVATTNVLSDKKWVDWYLAENRRHLSIAHEKVARWALEKGIEYERGSNSGFFIWVNLGKKYAEHHHAIIDDLSATTMKGLLKRRVFLADGVRFGSKRPVGFE